MNKRVFLYGGIFFLFTLIIISTMLNLESVNASTLQQAEKTPIAHNFQPAEPGWITQWWEDQSSESLADEHQAKGGDSYYINLFERPFTANEMIYHPEVDIIRTEISQDDVFYYFTIRLSGVNQNTNMLSAWYGVEIDLDVDGRGDILISAKGDNNLYWNIDEVYVFEDQDNDVGGDNPLRIDEIDYSLNGYETTIFSPDYLTDPDVAWKRIDPEDTNAIELAIKKSVLNYDSYFLWSVWAQDGIQTPSSMDIHDFYTLVQAGSPIFENDNYPIKEVYLIDNTCRLPFGFEPDGTEIGVCFAIKPTPVPTLVPVVRTGCNCSTPTGLSRNCCLSCGFTWYTPIAFAGLPYCR